MPKFRITTTQTALMNGVRIEPGMVVEVVQQSFNNPLFENGGKAVNDAFMRLYGIDMKRAGLLFPIYLHIEQL